ncbi:MAG: excinuclease ABC subunit UvrC, partial [Proteobacteria bacterium]|nr:excinuclease ABC subunit UvrC [Pseudomonadota bacterium]
MENLAKNLPTQPGVYQMLNAEGKIIYVGKARNLKRRVGSYFRIKKNDVKTAVMMGQVTDIQVTITASENEALLLEANLIKEHHPRYNILYRDDKSYPYLFLSSGEDFPRLDFHRGAKRQQGQYFGPFPSAWAVRENLALIQKIFKIRQCNNTFFQHRSRPCLQYQIQRCTAPCVNYVSKAAYAEQVKHVLLFFSGKNEEIISDLIQKMDQAADNLQYEQAAAYRDQIALLRKIQEQQSVVSDHGNIDILGASEQMNEIAIVVMYIRNGRLIGNKAFFPKITLTANLAEAISAFIPQYYFNAIHREEPVERIVVSRALPDKIWIENALNEILDRKITITDRKLPLFKQWQNMADTNASYALSQHLAKHNKVAAQLEALKKALDFPNLIQRMECFDISHTSGKLTVASCVVFNDQGPLNSDYRRFNIKDITPGDDYAAMNQALTRHYTRIKEEEKSLPDLLIIDGGPGQLHQAEQVLEELQVSGVNLMAVSKGPARKPGLEQLWLSGHKSPIR